MAIALGEAFRPLVETSTPGTYVAVGGMVEFEQSDAQTIETFPTFGVTTPLGVPSPAEISFSLSGYFDAADAGQTRLRTIAQARGTVNMRFLHDGTNGYTVLCRVASRTSGASAEGGPQNQTYEFAPAGDPVIVGTGPLP